ncbi:DNA-binding transcriptional LysR family regulator [Lachnotalea glycerini]|uniref:DNA-binding transcriptional LysR family regulator n=1 Tax=Lachnotalea glycerini TaxID=1763509 RepID=A0A318ENS6_9FIRM|nr:LysR family transcriptional regulator [Lachnotalea glycerini]PXV86676.1 DNA-binding transcriptional LysR family regulator [Lachnotalea glycerini]
MDLHYLEIFNAVAKYESYKKASEVLHISQPALSIQIKKLEAQIGLKLFDKIGNKIFLSENGVMLQEYTKRIFSIIEDLETAIYDTQSFIGGTLNIGGSNTPGSYILPDVIGEFKKLYPSTKFSLHIGNTSEIYHLINNGTLDIAVNGGSCFYNEHIYVEKLFADKLVIVASPQNPYCNYPEINISDLRKMSFVVHKTDSQLYTYYINFIEQIKIPENINMYLGNVDAIKRAVSSNLGVSLLPYVAVKFELQFGLLKMLNVPEVHMDYPYSLIYNENKALSATSKKFIDFVRSRI